LRVEARRQTGATPISVSRWARSRALGIPTSMFTVMFAIGRAVGWVAHWDEMISEPGRRISRPRQLYTGSDKRDYAPIEKR
ncbi:MAG: citrate/2-methylcitrate synthase, partial [Pseudomonadota bacterium]